jgi:DNA (cytosine-5)-methyltransferase 1
MRELCRIQTFPDSVSLTGDLRAVQRQAGNAVPSLLAEVIARRIASILTGTPPATTVPTLLPLDRSPCPAPKATRPVPKRFLSLRHVETPHPGTGQGHGALRRRTVIA